MFLPNGIKWARLTEHVVASLIETAASASLLIDKALNQTLEQRAADALGGEGETTD